MKLQKSLKVKIGKLSKNKQNIIDTLLRKNTKAINFCLNNVKVKKKQKYKLHSWVFKRLQKAIEYKANWEGIPTIYVNPQYSSQICSKCGELNSRLKHTYKCKSCGFEANADYNAGRNLQHFFLAKCQKERASINYAFNPNILEPKAMKDIRVRNISIPPTPKGVGIIEVIL